VNESVLAFIDLGLISEGYTSRCNKRHNLHAILVRATWTPAAYSVLMPATELIDPHFISARSCKHFYMRIQIRYACVDDAHRVPGIDLFGFLSNWSQYSFLSPNAYINPGKTEISNRRGVTVLLGEIPGKLSAWEWIQNRAQNPTTIISSDFWHFHNWNRGCALCACVSLWLEYKYTVLRSAYWVFCCSLRKSILMHIEGWRPKISM
jgi:hypothetical protein